MRWWGRVVLVVIMMAAGCAGNTNGAGDETAAIAAPTRTPTARPAATATPAPQLVLEFDLGAPGAVAAWQSFLVTEGFDLAVDGILGPRTAAATAEYQSAHGLDPTGELDTQTFAAMATLPSRPGSDASTTAQRPEAPDPTATPRPQATATPVPTATPRPAPTATPRPAPTATAVPQQNCHPSYIPCLTPGIGDYDCRGGSGNGPNYTGRVQVIGWDEFDLDRDGDGVGCE